ncbi:MAG: hypothetical protein AB8I08_01345 [Sandaracinaceae bacterium]
MTRRSIEVWAVRALALSLLLTPAWAHADEPPDSPPDTPVEPEEPEEGGGGGLIEPEEEAIPMAAPAAAPQDVSREVVEPAPAPPEPAPPEPAEGEPRTMGVCGTDLRARPIGPLQTWSGTADGMLGVPHRACPREEVALGGDGTVVAQTADLYGQIRASGRGRVSAPLLDPRVEGFVDWEFLRYQTVIRSVPGSYLGLGYLAFGASGQLLVEEDAVLALTGRAVLPTTSGLEFNTVPFSLDVGATGALRVDPAVRLHAWVNLVGTVQAGGPAFPRGGVRAGVGADLRAAEWLSFVLELASGFGYETALDFLSAQGGFRFGFSDEVGLEFSFSFPFLGGVRPFLDGALPVSGSLMLAWRLP